MFVRYDFKWDFEVPVYHNYVCAGAIHHNSGKTQVGLGITSRVVRREGPIYRRLRAPETRPLKIWVAPQTFEKYESNWEPRLIAQVFKGIDIADEGSYVRSPARVFRWHDSVTRKLGCGPNELWGKTQDQGFMAFESDVVDLIVLDEEPGDKKIHTSCQQRLATTNGVEVFTFTPLLGMSWTYGVFYKPTAKPANQRADRVWRLGNQTTLVAMGMADNPVAVAGGGVARLQADVSITEAERRTRLFGEYGYSEGLIFPMFADLMVEAVA